MRIFLLLPFVVLSLIHARSAIVSSIPLPKTYVQNLDVFECNDHCLGEMLSSGQIFSFLAHMPEPDQNTTLNEKRLIFVSLLNMESGMQGAGVRIAMLLPETVIGRYASSTTNSVSAYLLSKNRNFELKTINIGDESKGAVRRGLQQIIAGNFQYIIAPMTKEGAQRVADEKPGLNFFFPTVSAQDVNTTLPNLYFGGIDYAKQITALMEHAQPPLVIFYDQSVLGKALMEEARTAFLVRYQDSDILELLAMEEQIFTFPIDKETTNLKKILRKNKKIRNGTVFLNTPLVKSSMIMSQLTLYDVNATAVLSTQINYDPLLFDMTQPRDRERMIVANSITEQNNVLVETSQLLQNDILFDWINYATTIGADYFYHLATQTPREFKIPLYRQVFYPIRLFHPNGSRFELLPEPDEGNVTKSDDSAAE